MQLIYGGNTSQSLPNIKFLKSIALSVNEKHFSNTSESIKLIDGIIKPCIQERNRLDREDQADSLIIDIFRGKMTQPVLDLLKNNNIFLLLLPPNTIHLFTNPEIMPILDARAKLDKVEVKLELTILKPLHILDCRPRLSISY